MPTTTALAYCWRMEHSSGQHKQCGAAIAARAITACLCSLSCHSTLPQYSEMKERQSLCLGRQHRASSTTPHVRDPSKNKPQCITHTRNPSKWKPSPAHI